MSKFLEVYGANTHNLKNIDVKIPKDKLVVITGVSGSGKSSLAFNTIYSEGKKKYLESLSTYARMFIGGMKEEADVREISGLSPTISIDQKTVSHNPRSTVGTITEIYDFYKLLYLHLGERRCIKCGNTVSKDNINTVISDIKKYEKGDKFLLLAPILKGEENITPEDIKTEVLNMGLIRYSIGNTVYTISDTPEISPGDKVFAVIDRLVVKDYPDDDENPEIKRIKDSLELAFKLGCGFIKLYFPDLGDSRQYSDVFVCSTCGHVPEELNISAFSFNSHHGACQSCQGLGEKITFLEEDIVVELLTLSEGAINVPGFGGAYYKAILKRVGEKYGFDMSTPYMDLSKKARDIIMNGTGDTEYKIKIDTDNGDVREYRTKYEGIINTLLRRYYDTTSESHTQKLSELTTLVDCTECNGYKLKAESLSVYLNDRNIGELSIMSVDESLEFFKNFKYPDSKEKIVKGVLKNIIERLEFLSGVGLPYITISRKANTLSGGESQRIRLATQIGTKLEGIIYVLDEPSIGLHPRDNDMLITNLKKLRDVGNTLIVVEHDEDIMLESDYIIDIGPGAGIHGGEVVCTGTPEEISNNPDSVTGPYLNGSKRIQIKRDKRKVNKKLSVIGATENNLKDVNVDFPLGNLVTVTGVSGSGKSSLVNNILASHLSNKLNRSKLKVGKFKEIVGGENLDKVVIIDQSPIGRTPRSNPATYTGLFTALREVFSLTEEAKIRGYGPGRFSFNTKGGRCEACGGDGANRIEMHFLPSVYVTCEVCKGKRYNKETLSIKYKGKDISEVLDMTVDEATDFFTSIPKATKVLKILQQVGLGYIKLGQSSLTLSGGEAQRIKLSTELSKRSTGKTLYILDEPTTGLHFQDIEKLLKILHSLVDKGNSVLIIEHNLDVILNSDYLVDIGPEGGKYGGELIGSGSIEDIANNPNSYTGKAINKYLSHIKC